MNLIKLAIVRFFGNSALILVLDILFKIIDISYEANILGLAIGASILYFLIEYDMKSGINSFTSKKWQDLSRNYWLKLMLFAIIYLVISIVIYFINQKVGRALIFIGNFVFIMPFNMYLTYKYVAIPFRIKKGITLNEEK